MFLNKPLYSISFNKLSMSLLIFITAFLSGCGAGGGDTTSKAGTLAPSSIAITPATATLAKGQNTHFTATATYADGSTADITNKATWLSSSPSIATIDSATGVAFGATAGSTIVTASINGVTSPAASVAVTTAVITAITVSATTQTTPKGVSVTYTAMATYSDSSTGNVSGSVTWLSSNPAVATLNGSGIASSLAQGTTSISASTTVGSNVISSNTSTLTVTAPVLSSLSIVPNTANMVVFGTKQFTASGTLTDGTAAALGTLIWTSSNTAVATINSTGVATGVSAGTSNISASSGSVTSNIAAMTVTPGNLMGGAVQGTPLNLTTAVSTFAGSGTIGAVDATATAASFNYPFAITTDGSNLYVADNNNHKIRKIVIASGVVTTLAGSGVAGGDDGIGTAASFNYPLAITSDGSNLYVTDAHNYKIRKIVIASGVVTTLAGSGTSGAADGTGTAASFGQVMGITSDGSNLYLADTYNQKIRKIVIASGVVTTLAGSGAVGAVDATSTAASFNYPSNITTDGSNLYMADTMNHKIRKIVIASGVVTTLAGSGTNGSVDGTGTAALFSGPTGITTDGNNLYVSDTGYMKIRKIVIASGVVTTLAGSGAVGAVDATGTAATFNYPSGITTNGSNLFVVDYNNQKIRNIQ